jgi:CRISPR-associated endonuclease/helicase Cas3
MVKINSNLWAKKQSDNGVYKWLPLYIHLNDTMNIIGLLWEHWLSDSQKVYIEKNLIVEKSGRNINAKQLVKFLGAIHDIGKATAVFQQKKSWNGDHILDDQLIEILESDGFYGLKELFLANPQNSPHALAGQAILQRLNVNDDIGSIIGSHHGKPVDDVRTINSNFDAYPANYIQIESENNKIAQKWKRVQTDVLQWALDITEIDDVRRLPSITQSAQVILSGLLIMADWIASNESYFPLINLDSRGKEVNLFERAKSGWQSWSHTEPSNIINAYTITELYEKRFGFTTLDSVQEKLIQEIRDSVNPGIYIVEAPMGSGKTEAALAASEELMKKYKLSGMYFGLPTQATSNGIFPRIENWLEKVVSDSFNDIDKSSIQLVHGKSALNEQYQSLKSATNINEDEETDGAVIVNGWFSGKKTALLDDFVVGTVDQFLLLALKKKHLFLRHLGFSKKVVVIDEAHAYDSYMNTYLFRAIQWMGTYNVPVIMLSATLPAETRGKLIQHYAVGQGYRWKELDKPSDWETNQSYPLITHLDQGELKQVTDFNTQISNTIAVISLAEEDLMEKVKELISNGGILGIIVNTVKRAQAMGQLFIEYFGDDNVEILHSSFISTDRVRKENELIKMIGKNAIRPKMKIIIGTQVIEQSLDIDVDVMISDLAPMDLLIQRIGRLHRHKKTKRPKIHEKARLFILGMDENFEFESGSEFIYGKYLLMRTQYFLPQEIILPDDISPLVQNVYGKETINLEGSIQDDYEKAKEDFYKKKTDQELKAKHFILDKPNRKHKNDVTNKSNLIGLLSNTNSADSDAKSVAQVRDSDEQIEIILVKEFNGGYSMLDEERDISNLISDAEIAIKLAQMTIKLPSALSKHYNIISTIEHLEKINISMFANWQQQPWLKGSLGLMLDEHGECLLNGFKMKYDLNYGLTYEKEGK